MKRKHGFTLIVVAALAVTFVAGLAVTETIVGGIYRERGIDFADVRKRYIQLRENTPGKTLETHVRIDGKDRNILMRADDDGFIEPSAVHTDPDLKLVFLGGSTTQSINVDEKLRFPYLAGRKLEARTGRKVNAYNAAYLGNNSMHSNNILINKVVPLEPDFVVMMHNANDLSLRANYWSGGVDYEYGLIGQFKELPDVPRDFSGLLKAFKNATVPYTYNLIMTTLRRLEIEYAPQKTAPLIDHPRRKTEIRRLAEYGLSPEARALVDNFSKSLELFVSSARIFGIEPVLMTQPTSGTVVPSRTEMFANVGASYLDMHAVFNQTIREVGETNRVMTIDLEKLFDADPRQAGLFYDYVHYNEEGSETIAEHIADAFARRLM